MLNDILWNVREMAKSLHPEEFKMSVHLHPRADDIYPSWKVSTAFHYLPCLGADV